MIQFLNEIQIKQGETFKLKNNLGLFNKGDTLTLYKVNKTKNDIELFLKNQDGIKDKLYMDPSDNFDENI